MPATRRAVARAVPAADRTQVGETDEVAIVVANAELALSLERETCHRPEYVAAAGRRGKRALARV